MPFSLGNPRPEDHAALFSRQILPEFQPCVDVTVDAPVATVRTLVESAVAATVVAEPTLVEHEEALEHSSGDDSVPLVMRQHKRQRSGKEVAGCSGSGSRRPLTGLPATWETPRRRRFINAQDSDSEEESAGKAGASTTRGKVSVPLVAITAELSRAVAPAPEVAVRAAIPAYPNIDVS
ncbi:unnamed protein product [Urochloa humidicola]